MTGGGLYACEGGITTCALGVDAGDECLDDALLPQPPETTWGAARAGASPSVPRLVAEAAAWGAAWALAAAITGATWGGHVGGTRETPGENDRDPLGDAAYELQGDGPQELEGVCKADR